MAGKKKKGKSKPKVVRVTRSSPEKTTEKSPAKQPEKVSSAKVQAVKDFFDSSNMPERVKEEDAGFGPIKAAAGIIVVLIVGATFLANYSGGQTGPDRGEAGQGDVCEGSDDCQSNHICHSYKDTPYQCLELCTDSTDCDTGYSCTSVVKGRRKGVKVKQVCVSDDQIK